MKLDFDTSSLLKDLKSIVQYSTGFLEGVERGKTVLLENFGNTAIETLKEFIDSNARVDPASLGHMYEWYSSGSPEARLFDISYTKGASGLTINSTFRQSLSIKNGSNVPFYDKARIMENGIPVTISPKKASTLAFEIDGEMVFTKNSVEVLDPGGPLAEGGFRNIFDIFFGQYFTQSFIKASGIFSHLENPVDYHNNFSSARSGGKSLGLKVGYNWISKGGKLQ